MPRLFAVTLGGNCAPRSNTELHDVVFVVGESLEETFPRLVELWFGTPDGLHVDSWLELAVVDGHAVTLRPEPATSGPRLYFINLGAYRPGVFAEHHANAFVVADSLAEAKERARAGLAPGLVEVHTDEAYEVDEILEVGEVGGWHVSLEPGVKGGAPEPQNGWLPLPQEIIDAYKARQEG